MPITGFPANGVNPFWLIAVILYVVFGAVPNIKPIGASLQAVTVCGPTPKVDSTVMVTVKGFPWHPSALTGTTV